MNKKKIPALYGVTPGIGDRMRLWRKHKKLNGTQAAKILKVSQASYSDIENERSYPSAGTLTNMIEFTDLNIIWLLTADGEMLTK